MHVGRTLAAAATVAALFSALRLRAATRRITAKPGRRPRPRSLAAALREARTLANASKGVAKDDDRECSCQDDESDWTDAFDDAALSDSSSSSQTEREFVAALECRVVQLRAAATEGSPLPRRLQKPKLNIPPQQPSLMQPSSQSPLSVWEYRDLFEPARKVDIALYEEYVDFVYSYSPTSSVDSVTTELRSQHVLPDRI